jgi:hypothetical protein
VYYSFPSSTKSRVTPRALTADDWNALKMDLAIRYASVRLFAPRFRPQIMWVLGRTWTKRNQLGGS